jgi:hypothetical protein
METSDAATKETRITAGKAAIEPIHCWIRAHETA